MEAQLKIIKNAEKEASKQFLRGSHESFEALKLVTKKNKSLRGELTESVTRWTSQLEKFQARLASLNLDLKKLREKASKLKKAVVCFKEENK